MVRQNGLVGEKENEKSLGISPLVAAVLLIAVTMTIAGLMAYWATSFVKTSLPPSNKTESECRFAAISIYSCEYSNSTNSVNFILENLKSVELGNMRVFLIYPNATVSDPYLLNGTLGAGVLKSYQITDVDITFQKLLVTTNCEDVTAEKTCTRS